MKFLDEYRDGESAHTLSQAIARTATRPWTIMEVCGGQTHSIVRHGIDELLPPAIELVHGPGCPVCVTSLEMIDRAHAIAVQPRVTFCSFGDMLRVPGSRGDLFSIRAQGADVRVVYSPLDALALAKAHPDRRVVFFAIGFETTAPANAMAVWLAHTRKVTNFSVLVSHVLVPPMIAAILQSADNRVQGFLGPGHVCTVMGTREYEPIANRFGVPIAVTGFEPVDLLDGVLRVVRQLEAGRAEVEIAYSRAVRAEGNEPARHLLEQVFEVCDRKWRGIGSIPKSGYKLRHELRAYDAERIYEVDDIETRESPECISGQVLKGLKKPRDCPAFGKTCTPDNPLGATMVSAEGACAAYFAYGRHLQPAGRRERLEPQQKGRLTMELRTAILRKSRESASLNEQFFAGEAPRVADCARAMAAAFDRGARLFAMGNGGSACDAQHAVVEFMHPIVEKRPALPAVALCGDSTLLSAVGNDEDFAVAFARPLRLLARAGDIALGISTSGKSSNVNRGIQAAREIGMLTIGLTGKDGGRMRELCEFCFVVPSFSIHRIQETHGTLLHVLWDAVHVVRGQEDVL